MLKKVAARYDPHSNSLCVGGEGGGSSPPSPHSQKLASMYTAFNEKIIIRR